MFSVSSKSNSKELFFEDLPELRVSIIFLSWLSSFCKMDLTASKIEFSDFSFLLCAVVSLQCLSFSIRFVQLCVALELNIIVCFNFHLLLAVRSLKSHF